MTQKRTSEEAHKRKRQVVQDAMAVFLRYGYARTTMADLSKAAGMSRPALYELFPGKEELFAAVVRELNRETLQGYREKLPSLRTTRSKLQYFCRDWGTHGLRLAEQHPDSRDLFDLRVPAVREIFDEFIAFLIGIVGPGSRHSPLQTKKILFNFVYSLLGLEAAAKSVAHMEQMIDLQVEMLLAMIEAADLPS